MSHLALDARAILEYLNELGYRNISADQLKEFMKGMQRQSEISSGKSKHQQKPKGSSSNNTQQQKLQRTTTTSATATATAASTPTPTIRGRASSPHHQQNQQQQQQQKRTPVKIIKSKKPLCHFKFYLDICDHQVAKKIEIRIKQLGGSLEFFLTPSVTHFITDKTVLPPTVGNNNNTLSSRPGTPQTPLTPGTPQTPYSCESHTDGDSKNNAGNNNVTIPTLTATTPSASRRAPVRQTRADAILNRARRGQSSTLATVASPIGVKQSNELSPTAASVSAKGSPKIECKSNHPYVVWQTEQALRFFAKVQHDLKEYLSGTIQRDRKSHSSKSASSFGPTNLKGSFIKIESLKRNYRPYYQLFKKPVDWPKIELTREDGAFRLSPKKELETQEKRMTRKSRSRSSQRQHGLPAPVQTLKKNEVLAKSSAGQKAGSNVAGTCKQVKETSEKQCGVCEICKIEYDTLTIHLQTKDHECFAKNPQNFIALDTLIQTSADVNKFLEVENKRTTNMELEEMEVEDQGAQSEGETVQDPLEDYRQHKAEIKRCSTGSSNEVGQPSSPSPGIRERSKRITKGKHSSEKFQNNLPRTSSRSSRGGVASSKSNSPKKSTALMINIVTANANENSNADDDTTTATANDMMSPGVVTRKKQANATSVYSPPIRAMLPPSSMYKVVDTIQDVGTPHRKLNGAEQAAASPSIIVKFKKVRQTEIGRNEDDGSIFRKQRTSSDLPTDLDRQTTSDNVRANTSAASSASLDSSANESMRMELESEKTDGCTIAANTTAGLNKKAIAIAKRRKTKGKLSNNPDEQTQTATKAVTPSSKQRFPTAPIQPEVQLKNLRSAKSTTDSVSTNANVPYFESATRRATYPEATRKSSRTATAIVTAATTSSRLLRAAVEAAKKAGNETGSAMSRGTIDKTSMAAVIQKVNESTKGLSPEKPVAKLTRRSRLSVVNMEDRMGESGSIIAEGDNSSNQLSKAKKNLIKKTFQTNHVVEDDNEEDEDVDEDEDEDDDDDDDDEDDDDEDFILKTKVHKKPFTCTSKLDTSRPETREERAARRWTQRLQSLEISDYLANGMLGVDVRCVHPKSTTYSRRRVATKVYSPRAKKSQSQQKHSEQSATNMPTKKVILTSPPQRVFDITKSERIHKQRYAFERLPVTDLWYRVYTRQDTCEERYFEYYGSKNYRKLPYEMGPIPFDFTLTGNAAHCVLCQKSRKINIEPKKAEEHTNVTGDIKIKSEVQDDVNVSSQRERQLQDEERKSEQQNSVQTYTHRHKKLHLLHRYQQEQQKLMMQKKQEQQQQQDTPSERSSNLNVKCDSKASTPERETERQRAGSTHSNTSSCTASSTATFNSKKKYRNKHLNKTAFLSLELPPRKSPREHASTLALVSCIIRQRQDSMSKTNSETDEPATQTLVSPLMPLAPIVEDFLETKPQTAVKEEDPPTTISSQVRSPGPARSAAATPVEELRFATEISENVKRMRRGQNKYDHSPPIVLKTARSGRGKCKMNPLVSPPLDRGSFKVHSTPQKPSRSRDERRRPRSLLLSTSAGVARNRPIGRPPKVSSSMPSVRKTGSKKGVLEFEMDASALKALKTSMAPYRSPRQLEWEIDKYLELAAKDYDSEEIIDILPNQSEELPNNKSSSSLPSCSMTKLTKVTSTKSTSKFTEGLSQNTPPPTDYFSSDFDLYDLFTNNNTSSIGVDEDKFKANKIGNLSLYNSVALQNYFRKRKSLKCNRTGWPKVQKKKPALKHEHGLRQKIRFLYKSEQMNGVNKRNKAEHINFKEELDDDAVSTQDVVSTNGDCNVKHNSDSGGNGVITPPDSEVDDGKTLFDGDYGGNGNKNTNGDAGDDGGDGDGDEEYLDAIDDTEPRDNIIEVAPGEEDEDDRETMADSIEIERCCTADMDADIDAAAEADIEADADDDEEEDDDDDEDLKMHTKRTVATINEADIDDENTTMCMEQRKNKQLRRSIDAGSPNDLKNMSRTSLHPDTASAACGVSLTSTPTTAGTANMLRGLRRTPVLLNGSLGSCISPSEKAGDNSDIFTVSSDGLDTDLDLSNSHTQYTGDDDQQPHYETNCPHRTPKRKYDISKYAPNSKNSRTCAAEAATAAVKSLAISQFLKKEVRVTCRRLRPPFRRFRFKR